MNRYTFRNSHIMSHKGPEKLAARSRTSAHLVQPGLRTVGATGGSTRVPGAKKIIFSKVVPRPLEMLIFNSSHVYSNFAVKIEVKTVFFGYFAVKLKLKRYVTFFFSFITCE